MKALDIIEEKQGLTRSVGEPVMGGHTNRLSQITLKV